MPDREIKARFIEPMLLLRTEKLPQGGLWVYELKLDGFRAEGYQEQRPSPPPVAQRQGLQRQVPGYRSGAGCHAR